MSNLITDLDRTIRIGVGGDACRSLPKGQGITIAIPYHFEALGGPDGKIDPAGLNMWVLMHCITSLQARVDRLERLLVHVLGQTPETAALEVLGLGKGLGAEVAARREAEAQAAAAALTREESH